ncbi:hypothetical protein E2562_017697 [Oryza meyeriana var. granulata]|uniref:Stress enhanced protein 1 n=1 Tax=Oryza meyeriana var. granulata TaxID=110450 RepID=A0A6G1BXJ1_9ORYZ|nr:hypothetical protein E2562_017697 [Oryza meyeriana var. granulata]
MAQLLSSSASLRLHLAAAPGSLVSVRRRRSLTVRCEQGAKGGGLDVWLSRGAMLGFVGAITVELTTGKGVLQNVGLTSPVPTLALALTGVVGVATAFLIFQSASRD